jgi:hypothetical protein
MKLSHYPIEKMIDRKVFKRSEGGLHSTKIEAEKEKKSLSATHYVRIFWTGGEKLSNGSIRKSYFLLVRPKDETFC